MDDADIFPRVKSVIFELLGVNWEDITPNAKLEEDLGVDSLDSVEMCMMLEEEFGVDIPEEQFERLRTPGEIAEYLERHVS